MATATRRYTPLASILWAKQRIARHTLASVRRESRLKVAFVSLSATGLWLGIFELARLGFGFLESFGSQLLGTGTTTLSDLLMARLLSAFALALLILLIFSNVLISFSTLYRAREVAHQVQSPISVSTLFLGRFYECVTFSSWASAFLGSPILLAYGLEVKAPPIFYAALVGFYVPFVIIPAAVGSIVTLVGVRLLARARRELVLGLAAAAVVATFAVFRGGLALSDLTQTPSLQSLLAALGRAQSPFLPSQWLAQGVLGAADGALRDSGFFWLLLVSNALMLLWLATVAAELWFYDGWTSLADGGGPARSRSGGILRSLDVLLRPLPEPTRSLVVKDLKLFWRDPAQWSQFVLFFGIMALYVANLGGARGFAGQESWRALGTLLNMSAAMLILASLTTRFIFPLISLEGRRFWILGLSPVSLREILWQKLVLSIGSTSLFTVGLAVLSGWRLDLGRTDFALSLVGVGAATVALSGLAVGLGSLYPNFREENPARIVSGMGGTLNFLLSLLYVALVTCSQAVVLFWDRARGLFGSESFPWVFAAVMVWICGLTAFTCWLPLRLGLRHLERAEF